ncbi:HAD family hydrolase [Natrarchaeobius sp. A-rgal3]|uniref:HAD family hydrolase n=1 Tax=Natrarchaeobius versutus TaxID=1679078 RepID=UPI0035101B17
MTTAVHFDLDGTLCSYDVPFDEQFVRTVSPYGEPTDAAYEAYLEVLFDAIDRCESEPYRRAFEAVLEITDLDATAAALAREHCETELEASVVSDDAIRVVERVAATNPTGVLTNGAGDQQRAKLERHELADLVESVIVSGDVGVGKPNRRIFERAMAALPGDDQVYVGDSYEEDIVGARSAGFRPIYVVDDPGGRNEADAADAVVSSVGDLLEPDGFPEPIRRPFEPRRD